MSTISKKTVALAALEEDTPIVKTWQITNNSGVDLYVLDGYDESGTNSQQLYGMSLKQLTTSDSQNYLKAGATATVTLDRSHKDKNGVTRYNSLYTIIFATTDKVFPVKVMSVSKDKTLDDPDSAAYPAATVTSDDVTIMQQSEKFKKAILANATSTLAENFNTALQSADDVSITNFFKGTKEYTKVTLDGLVAVDTYYKQYPYVWVDYGSSKKYYLYTTDASTTIYLGELTITNKNTTPVSIDKSLPGFTMTYAPDGKSGITLYYADGQFVDDLTSDTPKIALQGVFFVKSVMTKNSDDTGIIPVISGMINGQKALGYDQKDPSDWSGLYTLLHPKDAMGYLELFSTIMGVVLGLEFIYKNVKERIFSKKQLGDKPSQADKDAMDIRLKNIEDALRSDYTRSYRRIAPDREFVLVDDLQAAILEVRVKSTNRYAEDTRTLINEILDNQQAMLDAIGTKLNNDDVQDNNDTVGDNRKSLNKAKPEEIGGVIPKIKAGLSSVTSFLKETWASIKNKFSKDVQEANERASRAIDENTDKSEAAEKERERVEEGEPVDELL